MKKIVTVCLLVLIVLTTGCKAPVTYRSDVSCQTITDAVCDRLGDEGGYLPFGDDHLRFFFADTDRYADKSLVYTARSENIDEIGVFRGESDEDVDTLRRLCEEYVTTLREENRAFIESYAPREAQKLDDATVRVYDRYVVYTVLSQSDRDAAFETIEELLQK